MSDRPKSAVLPSLELIVAAAIWGGMWPAGRMSVHAVPPVIVAALRFLVASGLFLLIFFFNKQTLSTERLRIASAPGLIGILVYNVLIYQGLSMAPAVDGAMIIPTISPIATVWISVILFKEKITAPRVLGLIIALVGQGFVFYESLTSISGESSRLTGDVLFFLAAFCWAGFSITSNIALKKLKTFDVTAYSCFAGAPLLVACATPFAGNLHVSDLTVEFWAAIIYMGVFATVIGNYLWHRGLSAVGPSNASFFFYLIPVFALLFSTLFLREKLGVLQLIGVTIVLMGVVVSGASSRMPNDSR